MTIVGRHLLTAILLMPIAGAILLLFVNRQKEGAIRSIANLSGCLTFAVSLPLWFRFEPFGTPWQFVERVDVVPAIGAGYVVGVDGVSVLMVLMTTALSALAILSSWSVVIQRPRRYYILLLAVEAASVGVFIAVDSLLFLVCWISMLASMYFLIGGWGDVDRLRSTLQFRREAAGGSILVLAGILALYYVNHSTTGVFTFDVMQFDRLSVPSGTQTWIFLALFSGFVLSVRIVPLGRLMAGVPGQAPTAVAVMLFAIMLKAGAYGLIRFNLPILPDATTTFAPVIAVLAIAVIFYGAVAALAQTEWPRVLAYATVSQMGLVMLGIFTLTPAAITGGVVHQINHAVAAGALLLLAGIRAERSSPMEVPAHGGWPGPVSLFAALWLVTIMASIGLPGLNGFVSEILILQGLFGVHKMWAMAAAAGAVLSAACMLRPYRRTILDRAADPPSGTHPDLNGRQLATLLPLVALTIWIGIHPEPVLRTLQSSVGRVAVRVNPIYGPAIAQAEADCNKPAAPAPPSDAPPGLMAAPPCDAPPAPAAPPPRQPPR
jgi:NADH-quinone oxidoreductase subunit M